MTRFAVLVFALVAVTAASADDKKDDKKERAVKEELDKLQGKWKQFSYEKDGNVREVPEGVSVLVTIEGTKWTVESRPGKIEHTFVIDPTQSPKTWDRVRKAKSDKEKDSLDKCIYKLDGDTLTICSGQTPFNIEEKDKVAERPKEFKTTDRGYTVVFKRVKE